MKRELIGEHALKLEDNSHLDKFVQIQLLCKALFIKKDKTDAQNCLKKMIIGDEGGKGKIGLNDYFEEKCQTYLHPLSLYPTLPNISTFPSGSWAINFNFKLRKPYISKDDTDFYIIDNPVKKEWIFKMPYIAPSQWKGALRSAMVNELVEKASSLSDVKFAERRFHLRLLFGDEKGEEQGAIKGLADYFNNLRPSAIDSYKQNLFTKSDETLPHNAGRLHFYPTYFTQIGLELINPHDRKTGSGIQPIYFETVPRGAEATFTLLYIPLDRIGEKMSETKEQAAYDMCLVAEGIYAMMSYYGFGAKTSSGFGVAEDSVDDGKLVLNAEGIDICANNKPKHKPPIKEFHKYLNLEEGTVQKQFCEDDGKLMEVKEYKNRRHNKMTPEGGEGWKKFRDFYEWYEINGIEWSKSFQSTNDLAPAKLSLWEFKHFNEIMNLANSFKRIATETEGLD